MENRGDWNQFSGVLAEKQKILKLDRKYTSFAFVSLDNPNGSGLFPAGATNLLP